MEVYLQPVDGQSNASRPLALRAAQNFSRAPVESEGPRAGGFTSPLLLLLIWDFQGCLHQQLCQTLPGSWDVWQSNEQKASSEISALGSIERAKKTSPDAESRTLFVLCNSTDSTNSWQIFTYPIVYARLNQQRAVCYQYRNSSPTEQLLPPGLFFFSLNDPCTHVACLRTIGCPLLGHQPVKFKPRLPCQQSGDQWGEDRGLTPGAGGVFTQSTEQARTAPGMWCFNTHTFPVRQLEHTNFFKSFSQAPQDSQLVSAMVQPPHPSCSINQN